MFHEGNRFSVEQEKTFVRLPRFHKQGRDGLIVMCVEASLAKTGAFSVSKRCGGVSFIRPIELDLFVLVSEKGR